MAPVGVNGLFKHNLVGCLAVFRKNRGFLMEIGEVFVKDPLVDWTSAGKVGVCKKYFGGWGGRRGRVG